MADVVQIITIKKEKIMPRGDKTGPTGEGPQTGRRMGFCAGYDHPGYDNLTRGSGRGLRGSFGHGGGFGRGFRGGFGNAGGFGRRFRHGYGDYYENIPDVSEKTMIENEIRILKDQLMSLEERLTRLGKEESK
jgi:hypothetical protein